MRVEYKENITTKIAKLYHELQMVNKLHVVEAIYLTPLEWDEFRYSSGINNYPYPKRVAIHVPFRVSYESIHGVCHSPTIYQTEEIEYHGFKVRKEYK